MKKLIVIEGLDGSGKATQAKLLAQSLSKDVNVRDISFPDYSSTSSALVKMYLRGEFGERPDDVNAYAASSFFAVDRYASFKRDWTNDYDAGVIVADRYTTSNAIHQCAKLPEEQWDAYLNWLFDFEYRLLEIPEPNRVIYLRVDPALSQKLLKDRYHGEDKRDIHEKDFEYLSRCRTAAEYCAKRFNWSIIECCIDEEMKSIENIHSEIMNIAQSM